MRLSAPNSNPLRVSGQHSMFLDGWRLTATLAVFCGHLTRPDILFDVDVAPLGRGTIPTFFIIGAYLTALSLSRGGEFLGRVAQRYYAMWAVFIPASLLVLGLNIYLVQVASPLVGTDKFDPDLSLGRHLHELFELLTFSGEYWARSTVGQGVFSNQAFWTMDYIMAYTVMTAAAYLLTGWRRVLVFLGAAAIAGPTVVLLSPLWLAGVAAFELHRRVDVVQFQQPWLRWSCFVLIGVSVATWIAIETFGWGEQLYRWSKTLASYDTRQYLGMAKRFLWQWAYIGPLFTILVCSRFILNGEVSMRWRAAVQRAANYALPFYAVHFTTIFFVQTWIPNYRPPYTALDPYLVMIGALALSVLFGLALERWIAPLTDRWGKRLVPRTKSRSPTTREHPSPRIDSHAWARSG